MSLSASNQGAINRLRENPIVQAWLVLLLAVCFGAALAGVHLELAPMIETNKRNETLEQVPGLVLGKQGAARMAAENEQLDIVSETVTVRYRQRERYYTVYEARHQGDLQGYVIKAGGQGYAGRIELLLGLDPRIRTITGLFILEQKETPGLGNKITDAKWRDQFIGEKIASSLAVVKTGDPEKQEIHAVTGATISSRAVVDIVNNAVSALKPVLRREAGK